jgi:hypothetical protein
MLSKGVPLVVIKKTRYYINTVRYKYILLIPKTNIHKGIQPSSKKVCVYGKVYVSFIEASRETQHRLQYVSECIKLGRHSDDIFEISNDFYDFMKEYDFENITKKMYKLFDKI